MEAVVEEALHVEQPPQQTPRQPLGVAPPLRPAPVVAEQQRVQQPEGRQQRLEHAVWSRQVADGAAVSN